MGLSLLDSLLLYEENNEPYSGFYHNDFYVCLPGEFRKC